VGDFTIGISVEGESDGDIFKPSAQTVCSLADRQIDSMDLVCSICREFFDDPVLARDGYAYCRSCIVRWTDRREEWLSPRTNERIEGHGVLRGDVERSCLARDARLKELEERCESDSLCIVLTLAATARYQNRPLLPPSNCEELVMKCLAAEAYGWEPDVYLMLELAHRGGALSQLSIYHFASICRRDRWAVGIPLLRKDVLVSLALEGAKRLHNDADSYTADVLQTLKTHLIWRTSFSDGIEIPTSRTMHDAMAGLYLRDWQQPSPHHVSYTKWSTATQPHGMASRLTVPLERQCMRGSAESPLMTKLESCEIPAFKSHYRSEVELVDIVNFDRHSRGSIPFPDSRGGDTDDEDSEDTIAQPLTILQNQILFLPRGFIYHIHCNDECHKDDIIRALSPVNEALLSYYQEEPPSKRPCHSSQF